MRVRVFFLVAVIVAGCLSWTAPVDAQSTDRSGIEGKVVDQGGGVLPGVTVTITSTAIQGGPRGTVSDGEGRYRFAALPAGTYQIAFELSGFKTAKRDLRLDTGFVATLNETLGVGGIEQSVTVSATSTVVDIRTTAVSTNLGKEALENLPTSRSIWQVMNMAPGLRVTGADVGGSAAGTQQSYSNYGTSSGGNRPTIDGVDTREDLSAAGFYYDYGAFQEVQIKAMGNDAETAVPGTNLVGILKSGSDTFHGSAFYSWEGPRLQSDNVDGALRARGVNAGNPLLSYHDANIDLGGPILKQRLWFYSSYRNQRIRQGVLGYYSTPGVAGEYNVLMTNATVKLTGQLSPRHRFNGFVQSQTKDYPERNADAYRYAESTWHQIFKPLAAKAEWSWTVSDRTFVNAYVGRWRYKTDTLAYSTAAPAYDTVTLRYSGAFNTSPSFTPSVGGKGRYQYNASISHYVPDFLGGSHDLKVGVEVSDEDRWSQVSERAPGASYNLQFQNGVPFQVIQINNPYSFVGKSMTDSVFVRDVWHFGERATFNLGARYERYHLYLPAQSKVASRFAAAGDFPYRDILTWNAWAPRAGVSLALDEENHTVLKATYGWFNFAVNAGYTDTYNKNAAITTTYKWNDLNRNNDYDDGEAGAYVTSTGASSAVVNPDLKEPKTHEVTLSLERQIAPNFSTRVSYVFRRESGLYQNVNVARPYEAYTIPLTATDPGPDGVVGTADDGGRVTYYDYSTAYAGAAFTRLMDVNTDGYQNNYHSIEMAAQKRLSNKWQLVTSFLATHQDVWRAGVPTDPNMAGFFPKSQYWEWGFKLSGSYQLPYQIQVAGMFTSQSGAAWAREVRFTSGLRQLSQVILLMEAPGTRRLPTQNLLNVRIEKRVKTKIGALAFQLDLFNVTNTNVELGVTARSGATFNQISSIVPPRVARLGVTYSF